MVPTLILVGLLLGRYPLVVAVAAVLWPAWLVGAGVDSGLDFALAAALVGALNTAAGVLVFQAIRALVRATRRRVRPS